MLERARISGFSSCARCTTTRFERLVSLHGTAGRFEDLVELYGLRIEATEDAGERIELLGKIAKGLRRGYWRPQRSIRLPLSRVEFGLGAQRQPRLELERVTRAANKWNDLLTNANGALNETEDRNEKIAICLQCAKWYGQELGHQEYAIHFVETIEALDPGKCGGQATAGRALSGDAAVAAVGADVGIPRADDERSGGQGQYVRSNGRPMRREPRNPRAGARLLPAGSRRGPAQHRGSLRAGENPICSSRIGIGCSTFCKER